MDTNTTALRTYAYAYNTRAERGELHAPCCAHLAQRHLDFTGLTNEGTDAKDAVARVQAKYADEPAYHISPCAKKA